jgi:Flp pilus assembly protein TadG
MLTMMHRRYHNHKGQAMVEFALAFPILLLIMLIIIELGHMLFYFGSVYAAAREGARYGAAVDDTGGSAKFADQVGMRAAAKRVSFVTGLTDGQIVIEYDCGVGEAKTLTIPNCTGGDMLRVSVQVNTVYESIVPFPPVPDIPLSSTVVRTVVQDVSVEGGFPDRPAPTATPTPNCSDLRIEKAQYSATYPLWHQIVIFAGEEPVTMNSLEIKPENPKRKLMAVLIDPNTTLYPNPDDIIPTGINVLWTGAKSNTTLLPLDGRLVNETGRRFLLKFEQGDYKAGITLSSWCPNVSVTIP